MVLIHTTVGKNQNIGSVTVCLVDLHKETVDGTFQLGALIIKNRHNCNLEAFVLHLFDFQHICVGQDRIVNF